MIWGALIAVGGLIVLGASFALRDVRAPSVRTGVLAGGAALVGLGAVGLQDRAGTVEWILTPVVVGALALLHNRLLFAGEGPGRI